MALLVFLVGATVTVLGFTSLVSPGEVPDDVVNYREKMNYRLAPRMPQYEGRHKIDRKIAKILRIQYQFGVPQADYDLGVPASPARFSYYGGKDLGEPRFVATREFDQTLRAIGRDHHTSETLSNTMYEYLAFLDPELKNSRFFRVARVIIGHYGKVFSNGEGSLGMRSDAYFTDTEIEKQVDDQDTYRRYQPGDAYNCAGHNLDQVPGARMLALVSVGMVARACRWVRAQQAIG